MLGLGLGGPDEPPSRVPEDGPGLSLDEAEVAGLSAGGLSPGRALRLVAGMPVGAGLLKMLLGGLRPVGTYVAT